MPIKAETGVKGRIDWTLMFAALGLVIMGTITMFSAASPLPHYSSIIEKHFIAAGMGSLLFLAALGFNYQIFQDQSKVLYGFILAVLGAVLVLGTVHKGHRSWLHLGPLTFQPSELARVMIVLVLAAFLDWRSRKIREFSTLLFAVGVIAPIMILILKQPDFGSTLTFFPIMAGMMFCAGAEMSHLFAVMGYGMTTISMPLLYIFCQVRFPQPAAGSIPYFLLQTSKLGMATVALMVGAAVVCLVAWRLATWLRLQARSLYFVAIPLILSAGIVTGIMLNKQLKGYQRNRFVAFVAPQADIQGAAYHVHQSQIAIGSGGLFGKGLFSGTQSQLGFLPERHTDFAFSVVGEEMGFVGTSVVVGLYLLMIWRIVLVGRAARDRYGFLVCAGLATMFAFQLVLNVGMCLGLMPVTGVPLPLISYGGSSLMITLWSLGIVANIYSRRYALL
jgi:rod shape determining protein RodA